MLFVKFLDIETEGAVQFVPDPPWPAIELAIRGLNGATNSVVSLEGIPPAHMNIAGGDAGRYIVSLTSDGSKYSILQRPGGETELLDFTAAGQRQKYPAVMLVTLEWAIRAAKTFEATGLADPTLPWQSSENLPQPNAEAVKVKPVA